MEQVKIRQFRTAGKDGDEWIRLDLEAGEFAWTVSISPNMADVTILVTDSVKAQIRTLVEGWDTDEMAGEYEKLLVDRDGQ